MKPQITSIPLDFVQKKKKKEREIKYCLENEDLNCNSIQWLESNSFGPFLWRIKRLCKAKNPSYSKQF